MFRSIWQHLTRSPRRDRSAITAPRRPSRLGLEPLEDRSLPSATAIAGFVYDDANNNGILDSGEAGLAGSTVELHRATGDLVAAATTDANGHYLFNNDPTLPVNPQTEEVDATFAPQPTNATSTQTVAQFDPSLGTLTSVDVLFQGSLTTHVQVENAEPDATHVGVQVGGGFTLSGAAVGTLHALTTTADDEADLGPFDGASDYQGADSHDFGMTQATASAAETLSPATQNLSAFVGTGTLQLTETAGVSSADTGTGNFDQRIRSAAGGQVRVLYHYLPYTGLKPGDYYVQQTTEPKGYFAGQVTNNNLAPLPNSYGVKRIDVHLDGVNSSPQNNFAEVPPSGLGGFVYHDANDNGVKDAGEAGIGGVTLSLQGIDVRGRPVSLTTQTAADGSYSFAGLWAGIYQITETTQPNGYLNGQASAGSLGGNAAYGDYVGLIKVSPGGQGVNYNFGKVLPSSLAGFVYVDANGNGIKDPGELPFGNITITLTGTDDLGNSVYRILSTAADGSYQFAGLRPGSYTITAAQPPDFLPGKDTPGSLGGTAGLDQLFVNLGENLNGTDYDFAQLTAPPQVITPQITPVPLSPPANPATSFGKWLFLS